MKEKRVSSTILLISLQLLFMSFSLAVHDLHASYVSPGDFYQPGELSVNRTTIPDTIAPVELDVYAPAASDFYPVVIFQHGFSASIGGYETIANQLSSHGFVVVLPQMYPPGDFGAAPTPEAEAALGVQIVAWVQANINDYISVNANTIMLGLAGHSRGGQTAYRIAVAIPQTIKALSGVDPVDGIELFGQTPFITGPLSFDIPTYILGTGLGPIVVNNFIACAPEYAGPKQFYCASPIPTWLVTATTQGHADMIDEEDFTPFCPGGPDRDGMRSLTGGTLAAFFSGILQGNADALNVLRDPGSAPVPVEMERNKIGNTCQTSTAIPTLSEWGMLIFMTIIMGSGVVFILKRKVA